MFVMDNLDSGNIMRTAIRLVPVLFFLATAQISFSQQENWYVLQLMHPLNEGQIKSTIGTIISGSNGAQVWYNGAKSNTFGCKSQELISWSSIVAELMQHDVFVADVTYGNVHYSGTAARSSYFFAQACYYAGHADQMPVGWIAQLNHDEWDALPENVRSYFQSNNNFEIVEK